MNRKLALVLVWTLPAAIFAGATAHVQAHFAMPATPPRLGAAERAEVVRVLRGALTAAPAAAPRGLDRALDDRGPLIVTVWSNGAPAARAIGRGDTIAAAVVDAAAAMRTDPALAKLAPADVAAARIQVDLAIARAPLGDGDPLFATVRFPGVSAELADAAALHPGLDGVGAIDDGGGETFLAPGDLVADHLLARSQPVPLLPDLSPGLDRKGVAALIDPHRGARWFRFRTDTFVERPLAARGDGAPLPLTRGFPPAPPVTAENLRKAALAGARYLVAHLSPGGRYVYEQDLATGHRTDPEHGAYSIPRHAGVTYFLAQVYRATRDESLREPIERAAAHLEALVDAGGCTLDVDGAPAACVRDRNEDRASLGSSALTVVALVEYEKATGDARFRPLADKLARWILWMQRDDGSFTHIYDVRAKRKDDRPTMLYFSGEAALALARMYDLTHDDRYARACERALDWLTSWYDFFLGGFFYGEEHWTCIAAEAIWPAVDKPTYQDFCDGYGEFLRGQQPAPGDLPDQDDLAGSYNESAPFAMPPNTPAGSRTEAMISAYLLGVHRGDPDPRIRAQILAAAGYLLREQVGPDGDFAARGGDADGGMTAGPIERTVRIDYVQHTGSAMLRAADLIDPPATTP